MTVSQKINQIQDNNYDDDITVEGVPKGYFPAVTSNVLPDGSSTREVRVDLFQLEQSPGGRMDTNTGLYIRGDGENDVKVTVYQGSSEVATNTTAYS